jgi:REP-associated tyrosine transposase
MSRELRLDYPGSLWHITSTGSGGRDIDRDDADRLRFIDLLGKAVDRSGWILYAYALMSNHFDLLLRLTAPKLSTGMQWLNGEYARAFNRRHRRVGRLFRAGFHGVLVDEHTYFLDVLRDVALNPVQASIARKPEDYVWSSHRAIVGNAPAPKWLAVNDVLAHFGGKQAAARERYRSFVNEAIGSERRPWDDVIGQIYLGSDAWLDDVRERIARKLRSDDHPRVQREIVRHTMSDIVAAVAASWSSGENVIRSGRGGVPRLVAAWLGCYEAFLTNREIASGLRLRSAARVTQMIRQCDQAIDASSALRAAIDRAVATLRRKN